MPGSCALFSTREDGSLQGKQSPVWTGAAPETKEPSFYSESSGMGHYGVQGDIQVNWMGKKTKKTIYAMTSGK